MTRAASRANQDSIESELYFPRANDEDSRIRLRAPESPLESSVSFANDESALEADSDFIQFLCGRFQVDRERGMALLATLLDGYVPNAAYPIHTLEHRQEPVSEDEAS